MCAVAERVRRRIDLSDQSRSTLLTPKRVHDSLVVRWLRRPNFRFVRDVGPTLGAQCSNGRIPQYRARAVRWHRIARCYCAFH